MSTSKKAVHPPKARLRTDQRLGPTTEASSGVLLATPSAKAKPLKIPSKGQSTNSNPLGSKLSSTEHLKW